MNKYKIIAICGKSASGKDTLLRMIMNNTALHEIVSCTTRPPREGEVNGKNYHHIIDPETLMPGDKYLSVSVLTKDSGLGDALSTSLFLMSIEDGKKIIESLENVEVMWVMPNGEQIYTDGFKNYTFEYENK